MKAWLQALKERLLTRGTKLQLAEVTDNSEMHWAVVYDNARLLQDLIEKKSALKHKRNRLGFTPYQLAKLLGRNTCLDLLSKPFIPEILFQEKGSSQLQSLTPEQFQERTGVEWITTLRFPDFDTLLAVFLLVEEAVSWRQLDDEAHWLGTYHRRDIEMSRAAPTSIRWIDSKIGYGLFAEKALKSGAYVDEYAGMVTKKPWFQWRDPKYAFRYPTTFWSRTPYSIDAEQLGNATRFLNHSEAPNCEAVGVLAGPLIHILFRTTKPVEEGEELRFDYGPLYWRHRPLG